jgi:hypothetical protein
MTCKKSIVRLFTVVTGVLLAAGFVSVAGGHRKVHGLTFQLVPSQNAIQPGEPVWKMGAGVCVLVMVINNSKRIVHYTLTNPGFDWEMDVRDASGKPVPETEEFRKQKQNRQQGLVYGRNMLVTLQPNETAQDTIWVSGFYDLSNPGQYSIQVRRVFADVGKEAVESNRIALTVVR